MIAVLVIGANCSPSPAASYEIRGGLWLTNDGFEPGTRWVVAGMLTSVPAPDADSIIDLRGAYVIPPLAEAHQHDIEFPAEFNSVSNAYLRAGVFYVAVQSDVPELAVQLRERVNTPTTVDALWGHGAITGARGHPEYLYEQSLKDEYEAVLGPLPGSWFSGRSYHVVADSTSLETAWARLMADRPDFVKVILSYSEDHERNARDSSPYVRRGLDPSLLPLVVARARTAGLRVSAHVETAADFHHAVDAGVDMIAHLPGYYIHSEDQRYRARIAEADAVQAARRGIAVITTTVLSTSVQRDSAMLPSVQEEQRRNLRVLHQAGVRLAIGSDHHTALKEARYLRQLGVFGDATILRMWVETASLLFPHRKVGMFQEGGEASFLALRTNPLEDLAAVQDIDVYMKEGVLLDDSVWMPSSRPTSR
jgi:imidazolonepropionase-like amidohydrolase